MPNTINDGSFDMRSDKENIPKLRRSSYFSRSFTGSLRRVSTLVKKGDRWDAYREEIDYNLGSYRTLDSKVQEQIDTNTYRSTLRNDDMCNTNIITLKNLMITFFSALEQLNKDNEPYKVFRRIPQSSENQKSSNSINSLTIATKDLILSISQPRKDLWHITNNIDSFLEKQSDSKPKNPFILKGIFPFINEKENAIIEIICVKDPNEITCNKIVIHASQKPSSDLMNQIKELAKRYKYEYDLDKNYLFNKTQSGSFLLNNFYWIKDWIQREMPFIRINSGELSSDKSDIDSAEKIRSFLLSFCLELINLNSVVKPASSKVFGFFKINDSKPTTIFEIINKSLVSFFSSEEEKPSFEQLEALFTSLQEVSKQKANTCYRSILSKYKAINDKAQLSLVNDNHPLLR